MDHQAGAATWQLDAAHARLEHDGWVATIDLGDARTGIVIARAESPRTVVGQLLGVEVLAEPIDLGHPADFYVRGGDLVAQYAAFAERPFRVEVYWRAATKDLRNQSTLQLELLVSTQTDRLDIVARVGSTSSIRATAAWLSGDARWSSPQTFGRPTRGADHQLGRSEIPCVLAELPGDPRDGRASPEQSYFEAVHPSDSLGSTVQWQGSELKTRHRLLDEVMEKGVIRRLRVRGWLFSTPPAPPLAAAALEQFLHDKLPLTT